MTYTFTHLSLEGLLVWLLLSKKEKNYFTNHRWQFILINIVATLPDVDVFFGYHRSYTHSLVIPFVLLVALTTANKIRGNGDYLDRGYRVLQAFKLICFMWILHIFLDLGWGPLMMFWPVDNHYYDLTATFRFANEQWWIFPLKLVGLVPSWTVYGFDEGRRIFFINLTAAEREQIYGHFIDFPLEQVGMHVVIFVVWLSVIFIPAFNKDKQQLVKDMGEEKKRKKRYWPIFKRPYTVYGASFMVLGLILGPIIGENYSQSYYISTELVATNTKFDPWLAVGLTTHDNAPLQLKYSASRGKVPCSVSVMIVSDTVFDTFFETIDNATKEFEAGNITLQEMYNIYHSAVGDIKSKKHYLEQFSEQQENITFYVNQTLLEENEMLYFLGTFENWNATQSFIYSVSLEVSITFERSHEQIGGLVLTIFGSLLLFSDQIVTIVNIRNKKKEKTKQIQN